MNDIMLYMYPEEEIDLSQFKDNEIANTKEYMVGDEY